MAELNSCPKCGGELPASAPAGICPKCLLLAGISTTDGEEDLIAEAATLPPAESPGLAATDSTSAGAAPRGDDGQGIGAYRDLEAIHDWSGGAVYKAYHPGLERRVVLRVLESTADNATREEFLARAETLSRLNHPNTVATLEAGEEQGVAYVAEEWIDGEPIAGFGPRRWREKWREGFFPGRELTRLMRDAALGLEAIHRQGLTHGRLNPDTVLIDHGGQVRIVGLGQASDITDDRFAEPGLAGSDPVAADIHRLGATFFFIATGKVLTDITEQELSTAEVTALAAKLNPGLSRDFCGVVARCLGHQLPFTSARDVATELNGALTYKVARASWRIRIYSLLLEFFGLVFLMGGFIGWVIDRAAANSSRFALALLLFWVVPLVFVITFESLIGWTPIRRLFGLCLLSHSGESPPRWRRLFRACLKFAVLLSVLSLPALITPLLGRMGLTHRGFSVLVFASWALPVFVFYLPSRWISCGWTYYDLFAGVTWGEVLRVELETDAARPADKASPPTIPAVDRIDQYDIHETLGAGGMGCVYRANDRVLGRTVAIKTLAGHLVRDPILLDRFRREARLAASVSHPNVAKVFGNGVWNDTPYIAMEFVRGNNLQEVMQADRSVPLDTAWRYVLQAAEGLKAAYLNGVVHRDIKPANLMITADDQLKITDFGVSRQTNADLGVTQVGTIVGTPAYMAPEQAMGKEVDCRCDIYSLGMTLYHMLAGRPPFTGSNPAELLAQQVGDSPPSLLGAVDGLTVDQHDLLMKMIEKKPEDRYLSYESLLSDLERVGPGVDRLAKPLKRITAAAFNGTSLFFVFSLTSFLFFIAVSTQIAQPRETQVTALIWLYSVFLVTVVVVYIVGIGGWGTTPGKRILGLRVVRPDGGRVGYWRAALRFLTSLPLIAVVVIPSLLFSVLGRLPYSDTMFRVSLVVQLVLFTASLVLLWAHPQRRTVHDLLAGTIVVRER